jgi:hypothetical protein
MLELMLEMIFLIIGRIFFRLAPILLPQFQNRAILDFFFKSNF